MGGITSKETRRISFDNTYALSPALSIEKSIEDESAFDLQSLNPERTGEILFKEDHKALERTENKEIDYWTHRVENLKNEHQLINKIIETEYEKTIQRTNELYETPKLTHERIDKVKPCFEWRSRVCKLLKNNPHFKLMKCYEENRRQPLVCSTTVQAFSDCVAACRAKI